MAVHQSQATISSAVWRPATAGSLSLATQSRKLPTRSQTWSRATSTNSGLPLRTRSELVHPVNHLNHSQQRIHGVCFFASEITQFFYNFISRHIHSYSPINSMNLYKKHGLWDILIKNNTNFNTIFIIIIQIMIMLMIMIKIIIIIIITIMIIIITMIIVIITMITMISSAFNVYNFGVSTWKLLIGPDV